jgi:uncharacterized protein YjlB
MASVNPAHACGEVIDEIHEVLVHNDGNDVVQVGAQRGQTVAVKPGTLDD